MERNLNNEDFEEFLKLKTDHYKLYPSDKVWKGIYQSLHTRKRWFQVGGSLLFLSALLFVNYEFNTRKPAPAPQETKITATPQMNQPSKSIQNGIPHVIIASSVTKATVPGGRKNNSLPTTPITGMETPEQAPPSESITDSRITEQPVGKEEAATDTELSVENVADINAGQKDKSQVPAQMTQEVKGALDAALIKTAEMSDNHPEANDRIAHDGAEINWLQEMAAMKLASGRKKRFKLQLYFSPTVSYRKLTDGEQSKDLSNVPLATNQLGVNNFVDHRPSIGLEIGSNVLFSPLKKLTLKTGLQLNYSRYAINAYKFYFEKANIELLTAGRISDTMSSYTSLRNFDGYSPEQLQNQYIQLSMPIGAEFKVLGNKRLQLNVAGTIQPSYLLFNDSYLLSSDFINYTKEPSLIRKWNVNTSAEAFVSYYVGGMRWQVGPQFRYQTLSSYVDRYPIKEYLFEYGVKIGVSKTLR